MPKAPRQKPSQIAKQEAAVKSLEFRLSADIDVDELKKALRELAAEWVFQKEKGEETGYEHFQGHLKLQKRQRPTHVRGLFLDKFNIRLNYCKPTCSHLVQEHPNKIARYVQKNETRIEGPWSSSQETDVVLTDEFQGISITWRAWQEHVLKDIADQQIAGRKVNVLIQKGGNVGKSFLLSYIDQTKKGIVLPAQLKSSTSIMQFACRTIMAMPEEKDEDGLRLPKDPKALLFDLPRGLNTHQLGSIYTAIETLKDGFAFDKRYSAKSIHFQKPRIWVMTNLQPNKKILQLLSVYKWTFWQIGEGYKLLDVTQKVKEGEEVQDYAPPSFESM